MKVWKVKSILANSEELENYLNSLQKENKEIKQVILIDKNRFLNMYNIIYTEEDIMEEDIK